VVFFISLQVASFLLELEHILTFRLAAPELVVGEDSTILEVAVVEEDVSKVLSVPYPHIVVVISWYFVKLLSTFVVFLKI